MILVNLIVQFCCCCSSKPFAKLFYWILNARPFVWVCVSLCFHVALFDWQTCCWLMQIELKFIVRPCDIFWELLPPSSNHPFGKQTNTYIHTQTHSSPEIWKDQRQRAFQRELLKCIWSAFSVYEIANYCGERHELLAEKNLGNRSPISWITAISSPKPTNSGCWTREVEWFGLLGFPFTYVLLMAHICQCRSTFGVRDDGQTTCVGSSKGCRSRGFRMWLILLALILKWWEASKSLMEK